MFVISHFFGDFAIRFTALIRIIYRCDRAAVGQIHRGFGRDCFIEYGLMVDERDVDVLKRTAVVGTNINCI